MPILPEFKFKIIDRSKIIRKLIKVIKKKTKLSTERIVLYSIRRSSEELMGDNKKLIQEAKKYEAYLNFKHSIKRGTREAYQMYYVSNAKNKIVDMVNKGIDPENILKHIFSMHNIALTMDEDIYNNEKETWKYILKINKNTLIKIATFIKQFKRDNVNSNEVKGLIAYDIDNFIKKQEAKEKGIEGDLPDQIVKFNERLNDFKKCYKDLDDGQFKKVMIHMRRSQKNNLEKNKQIIEVKNEKNNQE